MAKKQKKSEKRISNIPQKNANQKQSGVVIYKEGMSAADLAEALSVSKAKVVKVLMTSGIMNAQILDRETVELVAMEFGAEVRDAVVTEAVDFDKVVVTDKEEDLVKRPAVVTIMGHVDHGKTTLLDVIRNSRLTNAEAGGITQRIGAYQTEVNGEKITFIDTPGHAAFTEMRARGANITDIVILVVAADDGIMPQTIEAIQHAKASGCPIIVAVNKMDKPGANPDHVLQQLSEHDLIPEDWGGETIVCQISALKKQGVDNLLEMVILAAEMLDLKANPKRMALGTVIEASLDKGRGPLATLLVQNGTLKVGDSIVCGDTCGHVRVMEDDRNKRFKEVTPSTAVEVTGLKTVPKAGDVFTVVESDSVAQKISAERTSETKRKELTTATPKTLAELFGESDDESKDLNLIIKAEAQGSLEALKGSINKINIPNININIVGSGVGTITDTDVSFGDASNAIVIGFNVRPMTAVRKNAEQKGVELRLYSIIYKLLDDIKQAAKGLLDPEFEEVVTGQGEVRDTFLLSSVGTIAGVYVTDGSFKRGSLLRILRDGVVLYEGEMQSLRRFKDDVKEVKKGYECGITIKKFNDIKVGDIFEAAIMKEIERK